MKNPTIEVYFSSQKKIVISYGSNDKLKFPNKTQAKAFSYQLKKLVKYNITTLSDIQAQVYSCYRSNYLYLPDMMASKILSSIQKFDNRIDYVFKQYSHGNGSFMFNAIEQMYISLETSISLLLEYAQKYKAFALKNEMTALINILDLLEKDYYSKRRDLELCYSPKRKMKVIKLKTAL